jgi:hypothetical protein
LSALFVGAEGRIGRVEHFWLRARPTGAARARALGFGGERDPAITDAERAAFSALVAAFE